MEDNSMDPKEFKNEEEYLEAEYNNNNNDRKQKQDFKLNLGQPKRKQNYMDDQLRK